MDAKSFVNHLKKVIANQVVPYENNLLSVNYDDIKEAKRMGGIRDALVGVSNGLDNILAEFYENGGNTLPSNPSDSE